MKQHTKRWIAAALAACLLLALTACGGSPAPSGGAQEGSPNEVFIRNTSSSMGGIWYPMASAMDTIWQNQIPGVSCKLIPGSSAENVKLVANGETEVGWCHSIAVMAALEGQPPYDDGAIDYTQVNHIATIHPAAIHIVVRQNSKIASLADLDGKIVGMGSVGSTLNDAIVDLLGQYGITNETIVAAGGTVLNVSNSEAATMMQDGQIDVYFSQSTYPSSDFQEMENQVKFIGVEDGQLDAFLQSHPNWKPATIPAGTYKNQEGDVNTFSSYVLLACAAGMDGDLVYQMTKTMWEGLDNIKEVSADADRFMSLESALTCADIIPLHPGAQRYYEEIGLM